MLNFVASIFARGDDEEAPVERASAAAWRRCHATASNRTITASARSSAARSSSDLRKYISQGELIGKQGKDCVCIPCRRSTCRSSATARTDAAASARARANRRPGRPGGRPGTGQAGDEPGEHILEVDVVARGTGRDPRRGAGAAAHRAARQEEHRRRAGPVHRHPPAPARSRCATSSAPSSEALQAPDRVGHLRPRRPGHHPDQGRQALSLLEDVQQPAVQRGHHLHDGRLRLDGRRAEGDRPHRGFWIDTWLQSQYKGIETRYIVHDAAAREVDEHTFYHTARVGRHARSARPTSCARKIIDERVSADGVEHLPVPLLRRRQLGRRRHRAAASSCSRTTLLPASNLFGYGQVESAYGRASSSTTSTERFGDADERGRSRRDRRTSDSDLRLDQGVPGEGAMSRCHARIRRPSCAN